MRIRVALRMHQTLIGRRSALDEHVKGGSKVLGHRRLILANGLATQAGQVCDRNIGKASYPRGGGG